MVDEVFRGLQSQSTLEELRFQSTWPFVHDFHPIQEMPFPNLKTYEGPVSLCPGGASVTNFYWDSYTSLEEVLHCPDFLGSHFTTLRILRINTADEAVFRSLPRLHPEIETLGIISISSKEGEETVVGLYPHPTSTEFSNTRT